jgi:DNA-binding MarR family transcriptional regulator
MADDAIARRIAAVRRFSRSYTRQIGILREGFLGSPFSLTQVRVLYELAHREQPTATDLSKELNLDPGYLSRILRGFERRGLVARTPSATDGRQHLLSLTVCGRHAFAALDVRQREEIRSMLDRLSDDGQRQLVDAMQTIEGLLDAGPAAGGRASARGS